MCRVVWCGEFFFLFFLSLFYSARHCSFEEDGKTLFDRSTETILCTHIQV